MQMQDFVEMLQAKFTFPILVNRAYKLCDYRPAFGHCFPEIAQGYDYCGYCDMDVVFGNIRKFITDEVLEKHERIFYAGYLSLYKNNSKMDTLFLDSGSYPEFDYQEAFQSPFACYFDEYNGMELKCLRNHINVFTKNHR